MLKQSPTGPEPSFSQCGEDRIVTFIAKAAGLGTALRYADIGAAHPTAHNNTFLFYQNGGAGLLVDADPDYLASYQEIRSRDVVEPVAVVPRRLLGDGTITFYAMANKGWSSVSSEHTELARSLNKGGVRDIIRVRCETLLTLLERHFPDRRIDFLSLDVEGVDREILEDFDFSVISPKIIAVENEGGSPVQKSLLENRGYVFFGFTFVNSIYVLGSTLSLARF